MWQKLNICCHGVEIRSKLSDEIISSSNEGRPKPISSCCLFSNIWQPHHGSRWRTSQRKTHILFSASCCWHTFSTCSILVLLTWGFFFVSRKNIKWHHRHIFNILIELFFVTVRAPLTHDHMWASANCYNKPLIYFLTYRKAQALVKPTERELLCCLHFQVWLSGKPEALSHLCYYSRSVHMMQAISWCKQSQMKSGLWIRVSPVSW